MLAFFKLLEKFILPLLFHKDEYNIKSSKFNPLRLIVVIFLVANLFFTFYLLKKITHIHDLIKKECPAFIKNNLELP